MTKKIYKSIIKAALRVFAITLALILWVLYGYFSSVQQKRLKAETSLAARAVEQLGSDYFQELKPTDYRITWVDGKGNVLYDSVKNSSDMENHLDRQEIRQALETGTGESSRYSTTLTEKYLYQAKRLNDGTVLRLSMSHNSVLRLMFGMAQPIVFIVIVAAAMSFFMASRLSKQIVKPLNELDLDNPLENEDYDELAPLLGKINVQQMKLKLQQSDIEKKKTELDVIIDNMSEGMILLDESGAIISINKEAKKFMNAHNAKNGDKFFMVNRNLSLQEAVDRAYKGESTEQPTELYGRNIHSSVNPILSEGAVTGVAIVLFDVTRQENSERQRREFTANVSHELKTPLQSISGYSELIKQGMANPEDIKPFAEKIYSETHRLINMVEDIIELSQLDEGGVDLEFVDVDLFDISKNVIDTLSLAAKNKNVTLSLEGASQKVSAVPKLVYTMIYNLCDNGIKYNKDGGKVKITVKDNSVTVEDDGIGIPKEDIDRIFERFYRVNKSRSKEEGGTGLGLSIVKHSAKIQGVEITIDSEPGKGTKIKLQFPKNN
jgi:two-component system phosphate regulon sensor histidine kinase PhoR